MTDQIIETHPFQPLIPKGAKFLIIGSFPGKGQTEKIISETAWFYGAKRNTFWKIIEEIYEKELKTTFIRHFEGGTTEKSHNIIFSEISPVVEMTGVFLNFRDFSCSRNDRRFHSKFNNSAFK